MPSFNDFPLQPATLAMLAKMEITEPTPIQAEAIPALLAGKDLVGQSATGSGKTLAYSIPLVERLAKKNREVQALVLVPTRELAVQVNTVLSTLATSRRLSTALLVGGRPYGNQISALRYGSQIVVGTPGRVKDHLDSGNLVLSHLRVCVLDEADQMLDSGFAPIIEEILATTPDTRQMALFSATMPDWIAKLQEKFLKNPVKADITPATGAQSTIEQIAYQVPQGQKMAALCTLLHSTEGESSLIFGKTKFGVEKLGKQLSNLGFTVGTLHGNKSQRARDEVLTAFRKGQVQTLLATNVAARGLDIKGIYQVINYELPESSDLFTHRIGRTGRMGQQGKAITLLVPSDLPKWRRMARNLGQAVALQRLAIEEEAIVTIPPARPEEASVTQEHEQNSEQQPVRNRKHFSSGQECGKLAQPKHDSHTTSGIKRRPKDSPTSEIPVWQPEGFTLPERPYSDKARDGRRVTSKQSSAGRTTDKHKAHSFAATEPPQRTPGRKPSVKLAKRAKRAAASNRSADR
jgi:ATP-dependent RNA helicase DeaD